MSERRGRDRERDAPYPPRRSEEPNQVAVREYNRERDRGERPTRVIFVRNINYGVKEEEIIKLFSKYGDIHKTFMMIPNRGIAFVTFYDIRDAIAAHKGAQNTRFIDRSIDVHYSLPRESQFGVTEEQCTTSALHARLAGVAQLPEDRAHAFFKQFGDIRDVRAARNGQVDAKVVEFFDFRDCETAIARATGMAFDGGVWADVGYAYASRIEQVLDDEARDQIRRDLERHTSSSSSSSSGRHSHSHSHDRDDYNSRRHEPPPPPQQQQQPQYVIQQPMQMQLHPLQQQQQQQLPPPPPPPQMQQQPFDASQLLLNPMFAALAAAAAASQPSPQQQPPAVAAPEQQQLCFVGPDGQPIYVGPAAAPPQPDPYSAAAQRARDPRLSK